MKKQGSYKVSRSNMLAERVARAFIDIECSADPRLHSNNWLDLDGQWKLVDGGRTKIFALVIWYDDSLFPDLNRFDIDIQLTKDEDAKSGWRPSFLKFLTMSYRVTVNEDGSFAFTVSAA